VTSDLIGRIYQHRNKLAEGFTCQYRVHLLVYYELHGQIDLAIVREKVLQKWRRKWMLQLIEGFNPEWCDLYDTLFEG
jgi:putative endonuclease